MTRDEIKLWVENVFEYGTSEQVTDQIYALVRSAEKRARALEALSNNYGSGFATPPDAKPKKTPEGL